MKTPQRNNAGTRSGLHAAFNERRLTHIFHKTSANGRCLKNGEPRDCCNRTPSLFLIPPNRPSLFLPSEVQSRVCRPAAVQISLCKNRSGAPSLSPLLSSSSSRLSLSLPPYFQPPCLKKKNLLDRMLLIRTFSNAWLQLKAVTTALDTTFLGAIKCILNIMQIICK